MGIFSKKLNSKEYEDLSLEISKIRSKLIDLEGRFESEVTKNNALRGRLNKQLAGEEPEDIKKKESKYI